MRERESISQSLSLSHIPLSFLSLIYVFLFLFLISWVILIPTFSPLPIPIHSLTALICWIKVCKMPYINLGAQIFWCKINVLMICHKDTFCSALETASYLFNVVKLLCHYNGWFYISKSCCYNKGLTMKYVSVCDLSTLCSCECLYMYVCVHIVICMRQLPYLSYMWFMLRFLLLMQSIKVSVTTETRFFNACFFVLNYF